MFRSFILLTHTMYVLPPLCACLCVSVCVREPFWMHSHTLRKLYRREMNATIFMYVAMLYLYWKSFIRFDLKIITSIAPPTTARHIQTHTHLQARDTFQFQLQFQNNGKWHTMCYITLCTIDGSGSLTSHKTSERLFSNLPRPFYTHSTHIIHHTNHALNLLSMWLIWHSCTSEKVTKSN